MLSLTYEYKAIPTTEQVQMIQHTLDMCRKVWNFGLRERKDWINSRKCQINACSITSEYIILKLPQLGWLEYVNKSRNFRSKKDGGMGRILFPYPPR